MFLDDHARDRGRIGRLAIRKDTGNLTGAWQKQWGSTSAAIIAIAVARKGGKLQWYSLVLLMVMGSPRTRLDSLDNNYSVNNDCIFSRLVAKVQDEEIGVVWHVLFRRRMLGC
jgi:hypothetical protein